MPPRLAGLPIIADVVAVDSVEELSAEQVSRRGRPWRATVLSLIALSLSTAFSVAAQEQQDAPEEPSPSAERLERCRNPANPFRLRFECVGQTVDFLEETLSRDFAGYRSELRKLGITPTMSYTAQLMGNTDGGRASGITYAGTYQGVWSWNLEKLLRIPGLSFNIEAAWSTGRSLSADAIGNVFVVQSAYTSPSGGTNNVTLGEVYLQQQLLDGSLVIAVGRLAPGSTFATLPVLDTYLNNGINGILGSLPINDPVLATYPPGVEWGAQVVYIPLPRVQILAGLFDTNAEAASGGRGGLDFAFQQGNNGVLSIVQLNYLHNQERTDTGLPGLYSLGGFYDSNDTTSLATGGGQKGNYGIYAMFQQMVYRDGGPGSLRGMTVWAETGVAPKQSVNVMPFFVGGGLSYQGLIQGRGKDVLSVGAIRGAFSRYLAHTTAETILEASYRIAVTGGVSVTPDLQYVIRPSGTGALGNALVLGAQLEVSF
jgi:porin